MILRDARPEDIAWVSHSWVASFADSDTAILATPRSPQFGCECACCGAWLPKKREGHIAAAPDKYWRGQKALVAELLARSRTLVAESDGLLDGFICIGDNSAPPSNVAVVHYIYVRLSARERGVAKALVAELGSPSVVIYTHRSRGLRGSRLPPGWTFDPFEIHRTLARKAA